MEKFEIKWEYIGNAVFTRQQAEGAIPNGSRIVKSKMEDDDAHKIGDKGTVIGSISHPEVLNGMIGYFVEWDDMPGVPVGVVGWKISRDESASGVS